MLRGRVEKSVLELQRYLADGEAYQKICSNKAVHLQEAELRRALAVHAMVQVDKAVQRLLSEDDLHIPRKPAGRVSLRQGTN